MSSRFSTPERPAGREKGGACDTFGHSFVAGGTGDDSGSKSVARASTARPRGGISGDAVHSRSAAVAGQSGAEIKPLKGIEQIRQGARTIVEFTKAGKPKRLVQRCEKCDDFDKPIDFCSFGGFHVAALR